MRSYPLFLTILVLLLLLPTGGHAADPQQIARDYLRANADRFGLVRDLSDIRLTEVVNTGAGYSVRFQQYALDVPVWNALINVTLNRAGRVQLVVSNYHPSLVVTGRALVGRDQADARATAHVKVELLRGEKSTQLVVYVPNKDGPGRLAWLVEIPAEKPLGDWEVFVDAENGRILSVRNVLRRITGTGQVFQTNPVQATGLTNLNDQQDRDGAVPPSAYAIAQLPGLDGSGFLQGPYVTVSQTKKTRLAFEPSGIYIYTRSDDRFEEVMAYFHIDRFQRYIQALGFTNVANFPIEVFAAGITVDNSYFSPNKDTITFGTGGVDDAEDAEVILHEYGHAIQDSQVRKFGSGHESGAMGEGFGDYVGGSYGAFYDPNPVLNPCVADWDATSYDTGNPRCLRRLDSTKHYPEDFVREVHADGEMWSACLWLMEQALGRDHTHRLVILSHFSLTPRATFLDGANAILAAEAAADNDAGHIAIITQIFQDRGFLP